MGFLQLDKLLDGATLTLVNQADSQLGAELQSLIDKLPASLKNDVASTITNLFQAYDVSTALPNLGTLTNKLQTQRQGLSRDQGAALTRTIDLIARIARARLLLDQLYDELSRLLQSKGSTPAGGNTGAVQAAQSASTADALKAQMDLQKSMQEMQALSNVMKAQQDAVKSMIQNTAI